jgi:squalene synthase HpnC
MGWVEKGTIAATAATDEAPTVETPSGKGAGDENFPVASLLIRADLRRHVHAFYNFARTGDDIADNPDLAASDKVRRLERMAGDLVQPGPNALGDASRLAASLAATGVTSRHALDLLKAFTQDATKQRYADVAELEAYCLLSAAPVGRHVLDLHGESNAVWPANDALCNALQLINHLQDCGKDYLALDRVYLPEDLLSKAGASVDDLNKPALTPGLRQVIDTLLDLSDEWLDRAESLSVMVRDRRLALECGIIHRLARSIVARLRSGDPLAGRVGLSKPGMLGVALGAVLPTLWRRTTARFVSS